MITRRKEHTVFGLGNLHWVDFDDKAVAAYTRDYQDESFLIINNLSAYKIALQLPEGFERWWTLFLIRQLPQSRSDWSLINLPGFLKAVKSLRDFSCFIF